MTLFTLQYIKRTYTFSTIDIENTNYPFEIKTIEYKLAFKCEIDF